ncbi:MAG: glycosyltransferase [Cyclobacteriaceae bacterium]
MNILIIPSWYPSPEHPYTGIFIKEQVILIAKYSPQHNVGISTWGSHHEDLLLLAGQPLKSLAKIFRYKKSGQNELLPNCAEYFTPAFTWSRKFLKGNMANIIKANLENALEFEQKNGKIGVIHAHSCHPGGFVAMELAQKFDCPFVITEHMTPFPFPSYLRHGKINRYIMEPVQSANRLICVSRYLQQKMEQLSIKNTCVVNNFIDDQNFVPIQNTRRSDDPIRLLFIGRLVPQKGVDILLRSFKNLQNHCPNTELFMGGNGENEKEYLELSQQLGIKNKVTWLGHLNRQQVKNELQKCDIFLLPSRHENNPVALIEALSCGKPIVTTKCGGPEELVTKTNGLVANLEDADDFATKTLEVMKGLSNYQPKLIRAEFEKNHGTTNAVNRILEIYSNVVTTTK